MRQQLFPKIYRYSSMSKDEMARMGLDVFSLRLGPSQVLLHREELKKFYASLSGRHQHLGILEKCIPPVRSCLRHPYTLDPRSDVRYH